MSNEESALDLVRQAMKEKNLVHLCIDNQAIFPLLYCTDKLNLEEWFQFGKSLSEVTNKLAALNLPTINVQFVLEEGDKNLLQERSSDIPISVDDFYYDSDTLKVYHDKQPLLPELPQVKSDLFNKNAAVQHVFFKEHEDAFMPDRTAQESLLKRFLMKHRFKTLLVSGLYADEKSCVYQTVLSALLHGFTVVLLDDYVCFQNGKKTQECRQNQKSEDRDALLQLLYLQSNEIVSLLKEHEKR